MNTIAQLLNFTIYLLQILVWIIIIQAVLSWLVAFNVVNLSNRFVNSVVTALDRLLEPLLRPIRNLLPDLGGLDFSPMVLILVIILLQRLLEGFRMDLLFG